MKGNDVMNQPIELPPEDLVDIAIIGISCRFAGARDKQEYWRNLCQGRESIVFLEEHEIEGDRGILTNPAYVKACGPINDYDRFDAGFFGITDSHAAMMTPEHRLFLETAWEVMEDASYDPTRFKGEVGIYGSCNPQGIALYSAPPDWLSAREASMQRSFSWLPDCIPSNTLFHLGLAGEAVMVTAVCSGFHYAVNFACMSLQLEQVEMAVAGGVMVRLPHFRGHLWEEGQVYSRDGHCRPFDANGTGVTQSSGVATFLLKPLSAAYRDRDHIYAVIKGVGINNNGARAMAYGTAQPERLSACIATAMAAGDVSPDTITMMESASSGLPLTDAIEIQAAKLAFGTSRGEYCSIGSVKGNIGHSGVAAGGAGAIKAALSLYNRQLVPTINLETPAPEIGFPSTPFRPQRDHAEWAPECGIRRAGVTALGGGGYNGHMVLEEPPSRAPRGTPTGAPQIATLSAQTDSALTAQRDRLKAWLTAQPDLRLDDVCHSLNLGRKGMAKRWAAVVHSREELINALANSNSPVQDHRNDNAVRERLSRDEEGIFSSQAKERRNADVLEHLAHAWTGGEDVAWSKLHEGDRCHRVPLPTYPFERKRHWHSQWD